MKGHKGEVALATKKWWSALFAVLTVVTLSACTFGVSAVFPNNNEAQADDALLALSGTQVDVSINKTGDQLGAASLDKEVYYVGDTAVLTWRGKQVGNNLVIPQSIRYNDITIPLGTLTRVDAVQTENTEYERRMGDTAVMTTFESMRDYVTQDHQVVLPYITVDTVVTVDFVRVAPVYRMYNMVTSEHLFSTNKAEYDGWVEKCKQDADYWIGEGIDWLSPTSETSEGVVHRLYNAGLGQLCKSSHYYTEDEAEMKDLIANWGWVDDGVDNQYKSGGNLPVYTCYNEALNSAHHYTSNEAEWENLKNYAWNLERDKNGTSGVFHAVGDVRWYTPNGYYIVYHEQENLDGTYSIYEAQTLQGEAGKNTAAVAKTYAGFTAGAVPIKTIEADNSTRLTVKYTRNIYKVSFDVGEYGQKVSNLYYKYGEKIVVPSNVNANGYEFKGWYLDKEFTKPFHPETAMPAGDLTIYAKWAPATYKIHYELNGGENDSSNPTEYTFEQGTDELKDATKEGFKFEGWFKSPYYTENSKVTSIAKDEYGDVTLYAKFQSSELADYKVVHKYQKLDGNFPETESDGAVIVTMRGNVGNHTDAVLMDKEGFRVKDGWHQEVIKEGGFTVVEIEYERRSHILEFNLNGHGITEQPAAASIYYGAAIQLPDNPKDSDYHFVGWYYDEEGTRAWGVDGEPSKTMPNNDLVLYAKWTLAEVYTVQFDTRGGSAIETQEVVQGGTILRPDDTATTKVGYDFAGWFKDLTFLTGADFDKPVTENKVFYAKWNPRNDTTYTVRHVKQNADGTFDNAEVVEEVLSGTTESQTSAVAKTASSDASFVGFTSQSFSQSKIDASGNTVVEIKYERNKHKVNFDTKLIGEAPEAYTDVLFGYQFKAPSPAPTQDGYFFQGWYRDFDNTSKWNFGVDTMPDYDITLYAKWAPMSFDIKYELNGGTNDETNPTSYIFATGVESFKEPTRRGYQFDGWFSDAEFSDGSQIQSISKTDLGTKTLYAKWTALTYTIEYELNGGVNSTENPDTYTFDEGVSEFKDATQTDKVFAGWWSTPGFNAGTQVTSISPNDTGTIKLYAKWGEWPTANYKVKHIYQDASGNWPTEEGKGVTTEIKVGKVDHDTEAVAHTQDGFTAQKIENVNIASDGTTVVEVKYDRNQHKLKINYNGKGQGSEPADKDVYFGATIEEPESPTDENSHFAGWYLDSTCTERWGYGSSVGTVMPDRDLELFASWTDKDVWKVRFETNGGTYINSEEVVDGELCPEPEANATVKNGYTFVEWDLDRNLTALADFSNPVTENKTVYAKWEVNAETHYTVRHVKQNVDGSWTNATFVDEDKTGQTDTQTQAVAKTDADYKGFKAQTITQKNIDGDGKTVVEVRYERNKHTVSFNNVGHGTKPATLTDQVFGATITQPERMSADGYVFAAWYKDAQYTQIWNFFTDTVGDEDITLYAKWDYATYKINYNLNGGENAAANPSEYTYGTGVSKLEDATRTGCNFDGWFTDPIFLESTRVTSIEPTKMGEVTLYAKFSPATYKINYVLNGGKNSDKNPTTYTYGTGVAEFADAELADHYFNGWFTDQNFAADSVVEHIEATRTGEITLYAQFSEIPNVEYTVHHHFKKLDGNYAYSDNTEGLFYSEKKTGRVGTMTQAVAKSGDEITGFTVQPFTNVEITENIAEDSEENVDGILIDIFYDRNQHVMKFDYNGHGQDKDGKQLANVTKMVRYGAKIELLEDPTDATFNFGLWHTDKEGTEHWGHAGVPETTMPDRDFTLYAKWTNATVWTLTFDTDGGTAIKTESVIDGNTTPKPADGLTEKAGYTLKGWYTDKNYTTEYNFDEPMKSSKTAYAKWEANKDTTYTVRHINQNVDGTWDKATYVDEQKSGTTDAKTAAEAKSTREGDFLGFKAQNITQSPISGDGSTVVEIRYERLKYNVSFDMQGHGEAQTATLTDQLYGSHITAPSPAPEEIGYAFEGWYKDDKFENEWKFTGDTVPNNNITLYAKWRVRTYTITYKLDDGTNNEANPSSYTFGSDTIELQDPVKEGYSFEGWYTSSTKHPAYRITKLTKDDIGDKVLWARWGLGAFDIEYILDGGTNDSSNPAYYQFGDGVKYFADPVKDGYRFDGWYSDAQFQNKVTLIKADSTGKVTLYAKWVEKEQTYWIAPGKTITSGNTAPVANPDYKSPTTGIVKTEAQIEKDVKVLQDVSHTVYKKEEFNKVKAEYEDYMINDKYHLYTYYGTGTGANENDFVEFRIVQVGAHESKGDKTDGTKYSDHSVLTFQATHALPTAYVMNTEASNNGGWSKMILRNTLNNGEIYKNFREGFTEDVSRVVKWSRVGSENKVVSNKVQSSSDKFWLMSYSELVPSVYSSWTNKNMECEGDQYTFWNTGKTLNNYSTANAALVPLGKTRAGGNATSTAATFCWWTRSAYPTNVAYFMRTHTNGGVYCYSNANVKLPINICFSFGATETNTVTYNTNGGSEIANQFVTEGKLVTAPEEPTKKDYVFAGWYENEECTGEPFDFDSRIIQSDITLYAKWAPTFYTVKFDVNCDPDDIVGKMDDQKRNVGDGLQLTANAYKRFDVNNKQYGFTGWNTKADGTGQSFSELSSENIVKVGGETVTLYAQWTKKTLDEYSYWMAPSSKIITGTTAGVVNKYYSVPESGVVKTRDEIQADVAVIKAGKSDDNPTYDAVVEEYKTLMNEDKYHLYTKLKTTQENAENQYVEFRIVEVGSHKSIALGDEETRRHSDKTALTFQATHALINAQKINADDVNKNGWSGSTLRKSMNSGEIFNDFDATFTGDVSKIVKWGREGNKDGKISHSVINSADKFWIMSYSEMSPSMSAAYKTANINREGDQYSFWTGKVLNYSSTNAALQQLGKTRAGVNASLSSYSGYIWERTTSVDTVNRYQALDYNGNPTNWTGANQLSGVNICFAFGGPDNVYDVTFDSQGGTDVLGQGVNSGDLAYTPAEPTKEDFKFGGWYTSKECMGDAFSFSNPITANTQLYAKWIPLTYTVEFHGNGATKGVTTTQKRMLDDNKQLDANQFENNVDGKTYGFVKWTTNEDGTGEEFTDRCYGNITTTLGQTIKLYAQWTQDDLDPYWIAASSKTTTGATSGESNVANQYYTRPETSVVRTAPQIREDVKILKEGKTNAKYDETYARYQEYMNSDAYHLYTKLVKEQANSVDQYIEFRIINVGSHEAQGLMTTGGKYQDYTALTFQATHTLPAAYQMNKTVDTNWGWSKTSLRTLMNQDDIFDNFKKSFTDDVSYVAKWTRRGSVKNAVDNTMITTRDKFWPISYSELVETTLTNWKDTKVSNEGDQYQYWKSKITNNNGTNYALRGLNYTRNGSQVGSGASWMRTVHPTNYSYFMSNYAQSTVHSGPANSTYSVVPCFAFGGDTELKTVTYDSTGGTEVDPQDVVKGDVASVPENPTRVDFKFDGWYKTSDCSGSEFDFKNEKISEDTTLYAKWIPLTYHVAFDGNGATEGKMEDQRKEIGDSLQLTKNAFRKVIDNKVYGFTGWNTEKDGSGKTYRDRTEIDLSETNGVTIQLYAQWTTQEVGAYWIAAAKKMTLASDEWNKDNKYYTNPESSVVKTADQIKEDVKVIKAGKTESNTNYDKVVKEYTEYMNSDEYHLYTKLNTKQTIEDNQYVEFRVVEVGPHLSTGNKTNTDKFSDETALTFQATHTLPTGYKMNSTKITKGGWRDSELRTNMNSGAIFQDFNTAFTSDVSAVVKWSREGTGDNGSTSNVLLSTNDKFWPMSYSEYATGFTNAQIEEDRNDEGDQYTFWKNKITSYNGQKTVLQQQRYNRAGTNTTSDCQWQRSVYNTSYFGIVYQTGVLSSGTPDGAYGVVPCFSFGGPENIYEVEYDSQEGTNVKMQYVDGNDYAAQPANPTRVDFAFDAWYTEPEGKGQKFEFDKVKVTENKKLYANWIPLTYHVAFDGNGATDGEMSDQRKEIGDKLQLTKNAYRKVVDNKVYGFTGWNTQKDGKGTTYRDRTEVDLSQENGVTIQLYAQWTEQEIGAYWIAAAKKMTLTSTSWNKDNQYYTNPESSVVKTQSEIEKDVEVLKKGDVADNADYEKVKKQYEEYMKSDEYHLYTKLNTKQAIEDNQYVEFRVVQVGAHLSTGSRTNTNKFNDETAITFQATHTLPTGYKMNSTNTTKGGWRDSELRKSMNSGDIFNDFNEEFRSDVSNVVKWSREGTNDSGKASNVLLSTNDKFWPMSYSEYATGFTSAQLEEDRDDEGDQYTFWKDKITTNDGQKTVLQQQRYNRAGTNTTSDCQWQRSVYDTSKFGIVYQTDVLSSGTPTGAYGVVPCFSFGGPEKIDEVTYDAQEGSTVKMQYVDDGDYIAKPADPTRQYFQFDAWYTQANGQGTKWDFKTMTVTEDTKLYANWIPLTYLVEFDGNGSTAGEMSIQRRSIDDGIQLSANGFQKVSESKVYGFKCWNTKQDGTGDSFDDRTVKNISAKHGETIKLYAQWTTDEVGAYWIAAAKTWTAANVLYNLNENYTNPETSVVKTAKDIKADVEVLKKGEVAGNDKYAEVKKQYEEYMNNDRYHLYTRLQASETVPENQYVEFRIVQVGPHMANGIRVDGEKYSDETALTFQATHTLPTAYKMNSTNAKAGGWETSELRENMNSGDIFKNFDSDFTNDVAQVVKWTREGYDGKNYSNEVHTTADKFWVMTHSEYVPSVTDANKGMNFDDEGDQYSFWKDKITVNTGQPYPLQTLRWTRAIGNTTGDGAWMRTSYPNSYSFGLLYQRSVLNYATNAYSNYGVVPCFSFGGPTSIHTVTYDSQDGTAVHDQKVANNDIAAAPTEPTRVDFDFDGWYTQPNGSGEKWDFYQKKITADVTLYAKWLPKTYTIAYDKNTGTQGDMTTQRREKGDTLTLSANAYKKVVNNEVYGFKCWNTQADGNGISYSDLQTGDVEAQLGETVTLYAQWTEKPLGAYWIAASSKIMAGTAVTTTKNAQYNNPQTTVLKTQDQIEADMAVLHAGTSNEKYESVKKEYTDMMNNDNYHLYTMLTTSQTKEDDNFVEFRVVQVGIHKSAGDNVDPNIYKDDEAAVTFQATHVMPAGKVYQMNKTNTNAGGWKDSDLRKQMNESTGSIYKLFSEGFTSKIKQITKWNRLGAKDSKVSDDMVTTQDKLWLMSSSEMGSSIYASWQSHKMENEGQQYDFYKARNMPPSGNSVVNTLRLTRSGVNNYNWFWMRSANPQNMTDFTVGGNGELTNRDYASTLGQVLPCFAF